MIARLDPALRPVDVGDYVRLGGNNDGGYVLPISLVRDAAGLLSMGLGSNWTFERDCHAMNPTLVIHAYDHTVSGRVFFRAFGGFLGSWMLRQTRWQQVRRSWARFWDYRRFFGRHTSHFVERISAENIESVFSRIPADRLLVKIDIEGAEYEVLDAVARHAHRILGVILEVHDIRNNQSAFDRLIVLLSEQFAIVHVHANNFVPHADTLELTFMRRDLVTSGADRHAILPHKLDRPNDPSRPEYQLVFHI